MKFLNYTQTNKIFVETHCVRPKKYRGKMHRICEVHVDFLAHDKNLKIQSNLFIFN